MYIHIHTHNMYIHIHRHSHIYNCQTYENTKMRNSDYYCLIAHILGGNMQAEPFAGAMVRFINHYNCQSYSERPAVCPNACRVDVLSLGIYMYVAIGISICINVRYTYTYLYIDIHTLETACCVPQCAPC